MLSSSRPSQKVGEEDSSGSDAESDAGLEPKTDRFGFIVTNGSTAGSVGPSPELVRQREAKWINIIDQWDRILMKKTSKIKVQCQKGIPASLRAKCWPLLCGAADRMKQNENLYQSLDSELAVQSWVDVIERDLDRQFPFHEMFLSKDGHGQRGLFRVLKAYTQYETKEGYCQAQGPVAAVLLMNMPAEEAFWCLVQISKQYLPGYYSPLLEGVLFDAALLTWVLKRTCPAAHKHLQHHGVEPLMYATDWLMCLFTRHLPFNTLLRVWDLFFCYGVRVLLQVAVVLVRRVLGRATQRKRCQGQMETLERLRGVKDEVPEEDDAFIAEVCSVPLSARDLERQTEKEFEKWRKDRPSSTFDPRGRCHGYRMAWARARQSEEERDRKKREKGNLSVPLARSTSTLSLSPSLLPKKWRKGGKMDTGEWEGGGKVTRHFSLGAKEDRRSWAGSHFKVHGVQEEEEHEKQSEARQTVQKEPKQMETSTPTEHTEETDTAKEHAEQPETRVTEKEENQLKETDENKMFSEQTEEPTQGPAGDQAVENILQSSEPTAQGEELDVQPGEDETDNQAAESEQPAEAWKDADANTEAEMRKDTDPSGERMTQAAVEPEESTETEKAPPTQLDTVTEVSETSPGSETGGNVDAPTVEGPTVETDTRQQQAITETDKRLQEDAFEGKYHGIESLAEGGVKEESHTQTETETDTLAQTQEKVERDGATLDELEAEIVQIDSEQHINSNTEAPILCSPECIQPKEGTDLVIDTEIPTSDDTVTESRDAVATEPMQADNDQTQAEETQRNEEVNDSVAPPPQEEVPSTQAEAEEDLTAEHDGKASPAEISTSEEPSPEQPKIKTTVGDVAEEESIENVGESTEGEGDVFISTEPANSPSPGSNPQVRDTVSDLAKGQTEPNGSGLTQASGHRGNRPSLDFRVRKSSTSRGCRLGRRLSEDLFTVPQKTGQSQLTHNHLDVEYTDSQSNPGAVNPTPAPPEVTPSVPAEAPERTAPQREQQPADPPKRFGLFRRLRGEEPKKAKLKGTPKMQVPKILIQDFSDGAGKGKPVVEDGEEKVSSRERRRRRRERERREKEEEKVRKKREKELEKEREQQRRKPQTRGKSFQVQRETGSADGSRPAKTGSQTLRFSASYAESYF